MDGSSLYDKVNLLMHFMSLITILVKFSYDS